MSLRTDRLSGKESLIIYHLCQGRAYKEIAHFLNLTEKTVQYHAHRLRRRFQANNIGHLIAILHAKRFITYVQDTENPKVKLLPATAEGVYSGD